MASAFAAPLVLSSTPPLRLHCQNSRLTGVCARSELTPVSYSSDPSSSTSGSATPSSSRSHAPVSRRALLQSAALLPFVSLLDPITTNAASTEANNSVNVGYVFDSKSGSFVPPSEVGNLLHRDAGSSFDRCILAAEFHDNEFTHDAQLSVIDAARRLDGRPVVVGFEQFYRSHNPYLDDFVFGRISLPDMLERTDWDTTWGFDVALYQPIFEYCRHYRIPMRGLNIPGSVTHQVGLVGLDGLPERVRKYLPRDMDFTNKDHYDNFVRLISQGHDLSPGNPQVDEVLNKYYQVQVLWDEWMSQSIALNLRESPHARVVALIGSGHIERRFGVPDRLQKRIQERPYTIVPRPVDWENTNGYILPKIDKPDVGIADLVWYTRMTDFA